MVSMSMKQSLTPLVRWAEARRECSNSAPAWAVFLYVAMTLRVSVGATIDFDNFDPFLTNLNSEGQLRLVQQNHVST